jgi:hypothetical protein
MQVEDFARLSFNKKEDGEEKPVYIGVDDARNKVRNWSFFLFWCYFEL